MVTPYGHAYGQTRTATNTRRAHPNRISTVGGIGCNERTCAPVGVTEHDSARRWRQDAPYAAALGVPAPSAVEDAGEEAGCAFNAISLSCNSSFSIDAARASAAAARASAAASRSRSCSSSVLWPSRRRAAEEGGRSREDELFCATHGAINLHCKL